MTDRTCRKHQAADFHADSHETIIQAVKTVNLEEDDESEDTNETIQSNDDVTDSDSQDYESLEGTVERE